MLKEQDQALSDYIAQHGDGAFSEIEAFELGTLPTGLLRQDEINSAWGTKYFSFYTHCHLDVDELPFAVIDANSLDGIEDTLNSELSGNFLTIAGAWMAAQLVTESDSDSAEEESEDRTDGSNEADESSASPIVPGPFGPIDLDDSSLQENAEHIRKFGDDLRTALSLLESCDIRISSGGFLHLCTGLEDLKRGRFLGVNFYEFPDSQGPFSVSFGDLSDGQRKLINLAFSAVAASSDDQGKTTILVGDEIDNGIHVRAIVALYRMLGGLPLSCLCSTHSIEAVAYSVGRRVHMTRDSESGIRLDDFDIKDARAAAEQMGVTPLSLLAFFRLFVIVEGEHDRIVIESLLNAQDRSLGNDVVVLPIRGANNLMTSLEAQLFDYTDARVLVVLDNVRQAVLVELLEAAKSKKNGNPRDRRNALVAARARCQSHEERIVGDVIIRRFDKGDLSRFSLFGLSKRDIIEYLDPLEFGIDDWVAARNEFDSLSPSDPMKQSSFKDYLRATRNISIGNGDVTRASHNLGTLHPDLVALVEHIMKQLSGRSLELGFGFADD
jgi:hypothetical protein